MWSVISAVAVLLAQAPQPAPSSKAHEWCFDQGKGAQLCQETETACNNLLEINSKGARGPCKPVEPPEIQVSPTEPPAPPNPARQTPTHR